MWSYYGTKAKIIGSYPKPMFNKIIEPFAGAARYSLKYFDRDIVLVDKYETIIKIWKWLQQCSKKDILDLPNDIENGKKISDYNLCDEANLFMGFLIGVASQSPRDKPSPWASKKGKLKRQLKFVANSLFKIKHWKIVLGEYNQIANEKATWFIDPPYQHGGHIYVESNKNINYQELAKWCVFREGQVIVCENTKADWLPFYPIRKMKGSMFNTTEAIWSNYKTGFEYHQADMFHTLTIK